MSRNSSIEELVRTTTALTKDMSRNSVSISIVEQALDVSKSDVAGLYLFPNEKSERQLPLLHKRGRFDIPNSFDRDSETLEFLDDCREVLVINTPEADFFTDLLINPAMKSAIAVPLMERKNMMAILILNSRKENHYGKSRLLFIESFGRMAGGLLDNINLFQELKDKIKTIESMNRYQSSIFSSMSNLLVALDEKRNLKYFNTAAAERFSLKDEDIGTQLPGHFFKGLGKKVVKNLLDVERKGTRAMGLEGVYEHEDTEMDFSVNISPIRTARGKNEGSILIFSDQTAEQQLKSQMESAIEDKRVVKDMFSRYLSTDIVHQLMENPENIRLGGAKRTATIFFADITGYTAFSEGKDPEYIVEVLNEFFSVSLEVVIRYRGYIDKLIGDCIMAAFGVPVDNGEEDAINAVACAVEIQELVKDKKRSFFTGAASHLKVSIGMNTGPVVVGNLGSDRRMDYSVISDTVNVAARLEGVATANDIIISAATRDVIGDRFKIKELEPVRVKGKEHPIPIFNVLGMKR